MSIMIWATADCNMRCKYCYEGNEKSKLYMSKKTQEAVISFVKERIAQSEDEKFIIGLHGGEPFLHFKGIEYLVKSIKTIAKDINKEVVFMGTTNATLLDKNICNFIIKNIPDISVSLEGEKSTQDKMRPLKNGLESYEIAMENSLLLLKYLPNLRVRMTFDTDSVKMLYINIRHLIEKGFKCIVPIPNYFDDWQEQHLTILKNQINSIRELVKKECAISLLEPVSIYEKAPCKGGITSEHIYPNGEIYPCSLVCGNTEYCVGNIWEGINLKKLSSIHKFSMCCNPGCKGCVLEKGCDGNRCKLVNKTITGNYLTPPPMLCNFNSLLYELNN